MDNKLTAYNNLQTTGKFHNPDNIRDIDFSSVVLNGHEFTILAGHISSLANAKLNDSFGLHYWGNVDVKVEVVNGTFYFNNYNVGGVVGAIHTYMQMVFKANKDGYIFIPGFPFGTIKAKRHGGFWYIFDMETENMMEHSLKGAIGGYFGDFISLVLYAKENYTGDYK